MAEFDRYSRNYRSILEESVGGLGSVDSAVRSKLNCLRHILRLEDAPSPRRILDFGCGTGLMSSALEALSGQVFGADVSGDSLHQSVSITGRTVLFDGQRLPFRDGSFDLVVAACVFHHIEIRSRASVVREIHRSLAPGGLIVVFEHNPWNPVTRMVVNRCEFDRDAALLRLRKMSGLLAEAGLRQVYRGYYYAIPPLNRVLAALDSSLARLPLGAQYVCAYGKAPEMRANAA